MDQTLYAIVKCENRKIKFKNQIPYPLISLKIEIGYWRKAYLINHFIMRHANEWYAGDTINVPVDILIKLLRVCEDIIQGNSAALTEMVTTDGIQYATFADMDEGQRSTILQTVHILKPFFESFPYLKNVKFEYHVIP